MVVFCLATDLTLRVSYEPVLAAVEVIRLRVRGAHYEGLNSVPDVSWK